MTPATVSRGFPTSATDARCRRVCRRRKASPSRFGSPRATAARQAGSSSRRKTEAVRASRFARRTPRRSHGADWMADVARASRRDCRRFPPDVITCRSRAAKSVRSPSRRGLLSASRRAPRIRPLGAALFRAPRRRSGDRRLLDAWRTRARWRQGRRGAHRHQSAARACLRKIARASVRIIRPTGVSSIRSISMSLSWGACSARSIDFDENDRGGSQRRRGCRLSRRSCAEDGGARTRLRSLP